MKRGLNKENSLPDPEFGRESSESARAIHYVVQKEALITYVSARFAQADPGNVSGSTIERKKMSTKTIYKRIALVAVAALGAGVLSVAPASAVAANATPFGVPTTGTTSPVDSYSATVAVAQVAGAGNFVEFVAGADTAANPAVVKVTGSTIVSQVQPTGGATGTLNTAATEIVYNGTDLTGAANASFRVATSTAGTITVVIATRATVAGIVTDTTLQTFTITAAPAADYLVSAAKSTSIIDNGADANYNNAAADQTVLAQGTGVASTKVAEINVVLKNAVGTSLLAGVTVAATVSGSGLVSGDAASARVASRAAITGATTFEVYSDGTAGAGTITITVGTTVIATEKVNFWGTVTTLTAVQNHRIAPIAGGNVGDGSTAPAGTSINTTPAVVITAKDANGTLVPNATITALSSDVTVMSNTITVNADDGTTGAGAGTYNVQVNSVANTSGKTATLTFRVMSGLTVLAATTPVTYTLGGAVATVALSLNKASYTLGEAATATLTLKDAEGNAAFDGDHANILSGALASSLSVVKALQFNAVNTTVTSLGGVSTLAFNAPATSGTNWTISGTTGTGPATDKGKALSATAAITSGADIAALTTLINSLIAKINALSKLVTKIQKKVKA